MTAVIGLGLRLARAGGPLRAWSIVAGNAFGVVLLLVTLSLPEAMYPNPEERATVQVQIFGIMLFLLMPAVILLVTVGRLSSGVRDRRLAALRLLGLSPRITRAVAAVENGALGLVGAAIGVGVVTIALPVVGPAAVDAGWVDQAPEASVLAAAMVALAVTVVSVFVGTASTWERELPGRGRAESTRRRPGWWRAFMLAAGLVLLAGLSVLDPTDYAHAWLLAPLLLGGGVLTAIGIALATPLLAAWCARGLVRSGRVAPRLAGRAIQTDPVGPSRVVAGLGVATFLAVGALTYLGVFESTPQSRYALQVLGDGPQWIGVDDPDDAGLENTAELAAVPGVLAVVPEHDVAVACADSAEGPCGFPAFVGTCAELAAIMTIAGCDDSQPARIDPDIVADDGPWWTLDQFHGDTAELVINPSEEPTRRTIELTGSPITMDVRSTIGEWMWPPQEEVFVPSAMLTDVLGPVTRVRVIAEGGTEVQDRVEQWAAAHGYTSFANPLMDFEAIQSVRLAVWSLCGVALGIGLLLFALTAADRARERRRQVARQIMVGVPARVLRVGQGLQLIIPVLATSGMAIVAGLVLARGYAHQAQLAIGDGGGGVFRGLAEVFALIGLQSWLVLAGMITLAVLLAVGSTVPLIRTRLSPDLLRRE